ncbi:aldo/keto reductase [Roseateles sp.]|uniref:aldo/keto reductase n=1 Tax=Roseateles sp. TaxID=1971397 RepID=UPI0039EA5B65
MSAIPTRYLGRSGLQVSQIGLGTNNFGIRLDLAGSRAVIERALASGITLFDTADVYGGRGGSETILGEVLGTRRQQVVLATKFGSPMDDTGALRGASRRYIVQAVEASLRRLRTDWIDLYQLHRPDPATPIDEALRALQDLVRAGKVRYIGASNLAGWQVVQAQHLARELGAERFISSQDHYSLLTRDAERELIPALQAYGVSLLPYFPLESGLLTGKYAAGQPGPAGARLSQGDARSARFLQPLKLKQAAALQDLAQARGHTLLELAVAWLLAQPVVGSVITGATSAAQVDANVAAGSAWTLSAADLADIDAVLKGE